MSRKRNQPYIYGNAARQMDTIPQEVVRPKKEEEKQLSERARKNQQRLLIIDFKFAAFLTVAIAITLYSCVSYLALQTQITNQKHKISSTQTKLLALQDENTATAERLDSSVDLDKIYKIATKELGMVYADDSQIVKYQGKDPDYVRQYKDIPENSK